MDCADRLLLVDGHHLFHRTYNALPRSIVGTDGAPIQGVYGFAGAFLRLVRRFSPTHVCVPFDPLNIPGVPGIGPKTAAALLTHYGTIDALYVALPSLPARQADLLRTHQERVHLNHRLVTIVTTVDVSTDMEGYRWANAELWTASALLAALDLRQ